MRTSHKPNSKLELWVLEVVISQPPDGPIRLKFGLWLVLRIILVPCIHNKTARVAGTTLNLESTLTLTLLRRPLIKVGQMVSGHFLLTPWVVCNEGISLTYSTTNPLRSCEKEYTKCQWGRREIQKIRISRLPHWFFVYSFSQDLSGFVVEYVKLIPSLSVFLVL